jgi:hypothetical protein
MLQFGYDPKYRRILMLEFILIGTRLVMYLIIDPVWWFCGRIAGLFYPEYSTEYVSVALLVASCLILMTIALIAIFA